MFYPKIYRAIDNCFASKRWILQNYKIDGDPMFLNPCDMVQSVRCFCNQTAQGLPKSHGEIIRCIYDSLALKYRVTLEQIQDITGDSIDLIHIIGGGANNHFLNQLTADFTGLNVLAGPAEATVVGNILTQAKALWHIGSLSEIRQNSCQLL